MKKILWLASFILLVAVTPSCKMGYSFNGASIPPEAKTVSVQYFQNFAPLANPTLSQSITEALKDMLLSQTKLNLVNKNADFNFEGSITGYSSSPIAIQSNDQAALNRLTITVNIKYTSKLDEKKNFEQSFSNFADYSSAKNLSEVEVDLIKQINDKLTLDIFNKAFNNW